MNGKDKQDQIALRRNWWVEWTTYEKAGIILLAVARFGLAVVALADVLRRPAEKVNGNKVAWSAAILAINFIGPIAYFIFGRKQSA